MATYRLKRKTFGIGDAANNALGAAGSAVGNVAGGVMHGIGSGMNSKIGGIAGGGLTAATLGNTVSTMLGGGLLGKAVGYGATYFGGKALTQGIGKGLKNAGQSLKDRSM